MLNYSLPLIIEGHDYIGHMAIDSINRDSLISSPSIEKVAFPTKLIESDILFGAFSIISASLECTESQLIHTIKISSNPFFDVVRWIFIARYEQVGEYKIQD